jgi:hypothetical protein
LSLLALAGCNSTGQKASLDGARGATVAFDSIDGAPRAVFDQLVLDLNTEARSRQLAVVSRDSSAAYRVRGYIGAEGSAKQSAIKWVWDVYDGQRQRVLRIAGEQTIKGKAAEAWQKLDGPAVQKIARESMDQLAAFLNSPDAVPAAGAQVAFTNESSPEASGIFRIFTTGAAIQPTPAVLSDPEQPDDVPLPPGRPRRARTGTVAFVTPASN